MSNSNDPKSKETEDNEAADREPVEETGAKDAEASSDLADDTLDASDGDDTLGDAVAEDTVESNDVVAQDAADIDPDADPSESTLADAGSDTADFGVPGPEVTDADTHRAPPPPPPTTVVEHKSGFWPMALGGVVAAALGFGAATFLGQDSVFETETRASLDSQSGALDELRDQVSSLSEQDTALSETLETLTADISAAQDSIASVEGDLTALSDRVTTVEGYGAQITAIDERLTDLAKRPIADTVSREAIKAYEDELDRLRTSIEEQRKSIEETIAAEKAKIEQIAADATQMEERALEEGRLAAARSAMTRIIAALETGSAFDVALAELEENVDDNLDTLKSVAAEGVETQASLRERFPDAARTALRAVRDGAPAEENGGVGGILEKMFEVRSVEPREGDDPDAVLSRAEAAVRSGDLRTALTEIETLPDVAKDALSDWVADARTRLAALDEANAIAARLNQ